MPSKFRLRYIFKPLIKQLAKILAKIRVSPNIATLTMLILSLVSFFALIFTKIEWLFGIFVFLTGIFDGVDGAIARILEKETKLGAFFDSVADRISEAVIFFALFLYFRNEKLLGFLDMWFIVFISLGASLFVSYSRTRAENFFPSGDYDIGLMARSERLFFLSITALFGLLGVLIVVFMVLTVATAIFRTVKIYKLIKTEDLLKKKSKKDIAL